MSTRKKRSSSFKKFLPGIFFSKQKLDQDRNIQVKHPSDPNYKCNDYENPRDAYTKDPTRFHQNSENGSQSRIYENLIVPTKTNVQGDKASDKSSSSTLVSESILNLNSIKYAQAISPVNNYESAKPQVPPKPMSEISDHYEKTLSPQYPDVYYHSLEEINDEVTPLSNTAPFNPKTVQDPTPVGAQIKKVSTTFLISPKKEAEVRTMQPNRARSLDTCEINSSRQSPIPNVSRSMNKSYHYSAPTSPAPPQGKKLPKMPETVSPYGQVRQQIKESEEKNLSVYNKDVHQELIPNKSSIDRTCSKNCSTDSVAKSDVSSIQNFEGKEKTRQKVEAFYWQKLKELKLKEDEILKQKLKKTDPTIPFQRTTGSLRNKPQTHVQDPRTCSLPTGTDLKSYMNQPTYARSPFIRGAPERSTDSAIRNRSAEPGIVYRHSHKLLSNSLERRALQHTVNTGLMQRGPRVMKVEQLRRSNEMNERCSVDSVSDKSYYSVTKERLASGWGNVSGGEAPKPPVRSSSVRRVVGPSDAKVLNNKPLTQLPTNYSLYSASESGSELGETHRILQHQHHKEEDWHGDLRNDGGVSDGEATRGPSRGRLSRRDDPRRHTLAGNHLYLHPSQHNTRDMENNIGWRLPPLPEYAVVQKLQPRVCQFAGPRFRKPPLPRGCQPGSNPMLFDEDPGIMSEVETSSTGFRRGGKQRSSLPVVRTPSKTLERPLGLVFLQYRSETKRALLPNEITSIDTVKALFVRSFPKQLTMQYMDSPLVKIYIHDSSKDMFYELEDLRAHLREIRDRSVLRLFESTDMGGGVFPGAVGVGSVAVPAGSVAYSGPASWDQDQSYFSEPEIDSEYHHQHVHKSKMKAPAYYMGTQAPSTLPRGGSMLRAFSPAAPQPVPADRVSTLPPTGTGAKPYRYPSGPGADRPPPHLADCSRLSDPHYTIPNSLNAEGYMSSPERVGPRGPYEDPYYTQYLGPAAGRPTITAVIDEETSDPVIDDSYQMYGGVNAAMGGPRPMPRTPYDTRHAPVEDMQRLRVEKMERQLANLTGLVQKALQVPGAPTAAPRQEFASTYQTRPAAQDPARYGSTDRPPKLGKDKFQKSVSFEKSVSFSDDPPDLNSPIQHSPQHSADTKPTKPAIKSSTLPRTSSQERDRLKPAPPPKPAGLVGPSLALVSQRTYNITVSPEFFTELNKLHKQSRDLMIETRNLRRSTLSHANQMRQMMAEAIVKIGALAASFCESNPEMQLSREEEIYRQDMLLLENDLYELEATVERLRGQAANSDCSLREARVNMADIERIAMVLSKSSKTVADWKLKFPILQDTMKMKLSAEMEKVVRKEKLLEEEPERLELALRRCKKLTGTLVTLKRLACVQEQRLPLTEGRSSPTSSQGSACCAAIEDDQDAGAAAAPAHSKGSSGGRGGAEPQRTENALDALLDELQTFSRAGGSGVVGGGGGARGEGGSLRRLHSYPSGSETEASPPVRARGHHPPKPPVPERHPELLALAARRAPPPPPPRTTSREPLASPEEEPAAAAAALDLRHQELLKKQRALQEQYARLQLVQRSGPALPPAAQPDLKKTGSESNLLTKMNLNLTPAAVSGSLTHLAAADQQPAAAAAADNHAGAAATNATTTTTNKVYETDIL